jgi:hypothetical protein
MDVYIYSLYRLNKFAYGLVETRKAEILSNQKNENVVGGTDLLTLYLDRKDIGGTVQSDHKKYLSISLLIIF